MSIWETNDLGGNTTDGQTNSLTPYTGVRRFFLSVKFATSLLASLTGDIYFALHKIHIRRSRFGAQT